MTDQMKTILLLSTLMLLFMSPSFAQEDAREIMDRSVEATRIDQMEMTATLHIFDNKGRERVRTLTTTTGSFDGVSKTLLRFTEPADVRGTALLIYDYEDQADDMWIYLPALRKTRRIVSSEKGKSFMGSEFTNADMAVPDPDDFNYRMMGEDTLEGHACLKIESVCKTDEAADEYGFGRKISWIEKGSDLCYRVEFYNFDDEMFKVQMIRDYRTDDRQVRFSWYMEMDNVMNGRKSLMQVSAFNSHLSLSEDDFSPALLDR